MRAAVAFHNFVSPRAGGSRESLHSLLSGLARTVDLSVNAHQTPPVERLTLPVEHDVTAVDVREVPRLSWTNRVLVHRQWRSYIRPVLEGGRHDLLIAQNKLGPTSVLAADALSLPSVLFIRSLWETGWGTYDPRLGHLANLRRTDIGGRIQYPCLVSNARTFTRAMAAADAVVANSEFVQAALERTFDADSTVIYPPIDLDAYAVEYDPDGAITMVNPRTPAKGGDLFLDIAASMPAEPFLLVGPTASVEQRDRAKSLPNVDHVPWADDMRDAYRRAKAVVVPSQYHEPFGRVAAEAMASGIPTAVSDRGGLPEVVGDAGTVVTEYDAVDAWRDAILREIETNDPDRKKARVRDRFAAARQIEAFVSLVEAVS